MTSSWFRRPASGSETGIMTSHIWLGVSSTRSAAPLPRPLATTLLLGVLLLGQSITAQVAHAGKPAPPPAPVLPPVRYALQWLDGGPGWQVAMPRDINRW